MVELDAETLAAVTTRLRRVQGQIGGVLSMLEQGRPCADVMTQLAAASHALDRAGFLVISAGLERCLLAERDGSAEAGADRVRLEKLFLALS